MMKISCHPAHKALKYAVFMASLLTSEHGLDDRRTETSNLVNNAAT